MILRFFVFATLGLALFIGATGASRGAGAITITADSSFVEMQPRGVFPVRIQVSNVGPSVQGVIHVSAQSFGQPDHDYGYPIDLPSGTTKAFTAYPQIAQYAQSIDVSFDGPARVRAVSVPLNYIGDSDNNPALQVGMIGDQTGAFGALRTISGTPPQGNGHGHAGSPPIAFSDCYCSPDKAPDRAAGYDGISVLAIGEGAERLTDDQWSAIRQWVIGGGSLLLLGGAGSLPHLSSGIAAGICPLDDLHETVFDKVVLQPGSTDATYTNVAAIAGTPKVGAFTALGSGGHPLLVKMRYGAGMVTLVSFNPLAQPFVGTKGQAGTDSKIVMDSRGGLTNSELQEWAETWTRNGSESHVIRRGVTVTTFSYHSTSHVPEKTDPFEIKLPAITTIGCVLLVYFLLAVPITYFVLKRMGKLEWAWITTPLLSALCALVFYMFTANLYKASMSRRTTGVVSLAAGTSDARFTGYSEIFFPRGGSYTIQIFGAETLEPGSEDSDDEFSVGFGSPSKSQLETFDLMDGVVAPDYNVPNLAFRRLYHTETVPLQGTVNGELTGAGDWRYRGLIENSTNLRMTNVHLVEDGSPILVNLPDIAPGQSVEVKPSLSTTNAAYIESEPISPIITNVQDAPPDALQGTALLVANIPGGSFGPQLGRDASGIGSVALVVSIPIRGGESK